MKPKNITDMASLQATVEFGSVKHPKASKSWQTFIDCQEMGVSIAAQADLFGMAYGAQQNRVNKYRYFKLAELKEKV